ncbi:hydroxymethylglutaryl-CoA synthase family protein [Streptomyces albus]|uniref:hydroxymethylglutaryl-CoA synthase family protein n=1 Tax=Streptomyces albus TaxID=1888 RepID=UPI0004C6D180|nr:hydroxymethylglutaryl-CoA synthase [Streptomyces albus]
MDTVPVGIEAMNIYGGSTCIDVPGLMAHRGLDTSKSAELMVHQKTVALPFEDPVTFGVNAAKPLVDALSEAERDRIEMLVTCTESGLDFGKSLSSYLHHYLGLNRNCRLFEVKNACYAGTAGLQTAVDFIRSRTSPGAKALVIATDVSRHAVPDDAEAITMDWAFMEPTSGAGAAAVLVGEDARVLHLDAGAYGSYGYEVMDTCRPTPAGEVGDADLGLMSYLDCCEQTFLAYRRRVPQAHYRDTFGYLTFHTPFGGMVKGAHRTMMRKFAKAPRAQIEADFQERVAPGLRYARYTGNMMGGSVFASLAATIAHGSFDEPRRIGCFSYGSGCCAEFYSGVATAQGSELLRELDIEQALRERNVLTTEAYDQVLRDSSAVAFGTRNVELDPVGYAKELGAVHGAPGLVLERISEFHREYGWAA